MKEPTLEALRHQQIFLRILIFSIVTIMIWVGFTLFRSQQVVQIPAELQKMAIPLTPTIDLDVVTRIEQKKDYTDQELSNFPIYLLSNDKNGGQNFNIMAGTGTNQSTQASGQ